MPELPKKTRIKIFPKIYNLLCMRRFDLEKKLGAKIAYLRKNRGFSQEKLAEKADISEIYVGEIERGDATPTLEKLKLIANALDVEISELFDFSL